MYWNGRISNSYWEVRGKEANGTIETIVCLQCYKMCTREEKIIRQLFSKQEITGDEIGKRVGNVWIPPYALPSIVV